MITTQLYSASEILSDTDIGSVPFFVTEITAGFTLLADRDRSRYGDPMALNSEIRYAKRTDEYGHYVVVCDTATGLALGILYRGTFIKRDDCPGRLL